MAQVKTPAVAVPSSASTPPQHCAPSWTSGQQVQGPEQRQTAIPPRTSKLLISRKLLPLQDLFKHMPTAHHLMSTWTYNGCGALVVTGQCCVFLAVCDQSIHRIQESSSAGCLDSTAAPLPQRCQAAVLLTCETPSTARSLLNGVLVGGMQQHIGSYTKRTGRRCLVMHHTCFQVPPGQVSQSDALVRH